VADFLALGYCHFVVESITVRIRYMNSLDEAAFEQELVAAAVAACGGDGEEARARLQAAFDLLHTARDYYCSSESQLLDLTLAAGSTLGQSLRAQLSACLETVPSPSGRGAGGEGFGDDSLRNRSNPEQTSLTLTLSQRERGLAGGVPRNLLISAEVLEEMAAREPGTLELLRQALQQGRTSIVGGEYRELELPLLPIEAVRSQLVKGLAVYEKHLAARPTLFGRRRFGMTPLLPQILDSLRFTGVIHATLDDGQFPTADASRKRWEGLDGTTIEALLRVPIDASRAEGFVRLPHTLSGATDIDNQPTAIFAHWPGCSSCWYEDIQRVRRYTSVLGTFRSLGEYFEQTGDSVHQATFQPDEYRSPYLAQAVAGGEPDPISRWQRYYARRAEAEAARTIEALAVIAGGESSAAAGDLHETVDPTLATHADDVETDLRLHNASQLAAAEFAAAVGSARSTAFRRKVSDQDRLKPGLQAPPAGIVVINPLSFSRRVTVGASDVAGLESAIVEVPPLGFAVVKPGSRQVSPSRRGFSLFRKSKPKSQPMAEQDRKQGGAMLRNEFFEVVIDPHLGAIRAIYDVRSRGPRLSQQLAMRLKSGEDDDAYSIMAADEIRVVEAGPVVGEVTARGRLVARDGQLLANFRQTTRVTWGSRVIEIEAEIEPCREPDADPWNSYYAARFAWVQDMPKLYRGVNQATVASELTRLESTQFIEIRRPSLGDGAREQRTTILTAGLPYHRRCGLRKLDSLLLVRGETARRFRFGIGIDVPQPQAAALDFVTPFPVVPVASLPASESAWLFHLDNRAVVATHWEPIVESVAAPGARVRLLETEGRHVSLGLRSFRAIKSAKKIGGGARAAEETNVAGDLVTVSLRPYEWAEIEIR